MRQSVPPPLPVHAQQASVASTVRSLPAGTRPSQVWQVWRSAACTLLRLNPRECEALGAVFEDVVVDDDIRALVLDLLAGAGTFEAQVIMRRLLALAIARRDINVFAGYVQRLGFVEQPDGPTLRFLMSVYGESCRESLASRAACAYALGAAAGQARVAGDLDAAVRASEALRRDLLRAATAPEKRALVLALGNAGLPQDAAAILRLARDADGSVRAASALALRKFGGREARAQLVTMLADRELAVAQCALRALSEGELDESDVERLAEMILGARTARALDIALLQLLVAQRSRLSPIVAGRPSATENALRLLLGRAEAQLAGPSAAPAEPVPDRELSASVARGAARASSPVTASFPPAAAAASSAPPSAALPGPQVVPMPIVAAVPSVALGSTSVEAPPSVTPPAVFETDGPLNPFARTTIMPPGAIEVGATVLAARQTSVVDVDAFAELLPDTANGAELPQPAEVAPAATPAPAPTQSELRPPRPPAHLAETIISPSPFAVVRRIV